MKVGIITFTYGQNYGNKLQNYALLKILRDELKLEAYTLQNFDLTTKGGWVNQGKQLVKYLLDIKGERVRRSKQKKFDEFSRTYLNYYKVPLKPDQVELLQDFDAFVCGSDQIWNPYYNKDMDLFTAGFSKSGLRVSYAASIGLNVLPEDKRESYKKWLQGMDYIGIREEQGAKIVQDLTGRKATVQIDPTMLLGADAWCNFAQKPKKSIPPKYILTYFIRGLNPTAQREEKRLAEEKELPVINLNDLNVEEWYDLTPNEFVWMIKNATYVLADSFHATVFSIIFHRPIHCFERVKTELENEQSSRLSTLLSYFGMEECISNSNISWDDISYTDTDEIMTRLREKSLHSLRVSLDKIV